MPLVKREPCPRLDAQFEILRPARLARSGLRNVGYCAVEKSPGGSLRRLISERLQEGRHSEMGC